MIGTIFLLLIVFQLKHFIADYPLQGNYMLGKFKPGWEFVKPLTAHCLVHAVISFAIAIWFTPAAIALGVAGLDFVIHFTMDRIKAGPKYLGRFKTLNKFEMDWYQHEIQSSRNPDWMQAIYKKEYDLKLKETPYFWWALGLDQMVHHLTHYWIIWIIIGYLV